MRIAVTGTPGTGKTSATRLLESGELRDELEAKEHEFGVVHLNDVIREHDLSSHYDEERETLVADIDAVADWLADRDDVIFESHLAHQFEADRVVVLRCHPEEIENRLGERGEPDAKVDENAESEALDVILSEAVSRHGQNCVYEVETTNVPPRAVAREIVAIIAGEREPNAGTVSYLDYLSE